MRIAHIVPYRLDAYSGVYTSLVGMATAVAHAGHDVEVWNLSPWPHERPDLIAALDEASVERIELPESPRAWALTPETKRMIDSEMTADVVHLHSAFSPQNNLLARRISRPLVLSPHGVLLNGSLEKSPIKKQIYRHLIELPALRRMSAVCALTEDEETQLRAFGYTGSVAVIPNGVPDPAPGIDDRALRRSLGITSTGPIGLYVGRIQIGHKRLEEIARAVSTAPGWHLVVVGGDYRGDASRLESLVAALPGSDRIHLVGPKRGRELAEAFAGSDAFMLLSQSEGMSMALLEALSYRLPSIVSREVEETLPVGASGAGWAVTPDGLADQLVTLTALPDTGWGAARRAAAELVAAYRWETVSARYESVYRSAMGAVLR